MSAADVQGRAAAWLSRDLIAEQSWIYTLDPDSSDEVADVVRSAASSGKPLFGFCKEDFKFRRALRQIENAFTEARLGRGIAIIRNLPRSKLTEEEYKLMTWGIGLHFGVARPQGSASQYISAVRDAGTDYRSGNGRGYSSNAELDYHTDLADLILLSCYNRAQSGGKSMAVSSVAAYDRMAALHPHLVEMLHRQVHFSRQGEIRAGEQATYSHPIVDEICGRRFVRWHRNRVESGQRIEGIPRIDSGHWDALNKFDAILHDPEIEFTTYLQPGDVQLLNGHVTLHARTSYVDVDDPAQRRLMFRLWLAHPDSCRLPPSWASVYRDVEPNSVRGGILGNAYDERCRVFDQRQAEVHGMTYNADLHQ